MSRPFLEPSLPGDIDNLAGRLERLERNISLGGLGGGGGGTGPKGDKGDKGDPGPTGYNTAPIGSTLAWTGKTFPWEYVLADGARYGKVAFPDAYAFAKQEADAGNSLWTYRTSDETFTVPNLADKFIYAAGAKALGATGGEETHLLTAAESGLRAHTHGYEMVNTSQHDAGYSYASVGSAVNSGVSSSRGPVNANPAVDAQQPHNNMPPYVVLAQLVKVRGVTADATIIQGPKGDTGNPAVAPRVTQLPERGYYDGQVVEFVADAANGVVWRFRWNAGSSSAFKWEFVGGAALSATDYALRAQAAVATNSWTAFAVPLTVTLPLSGDYMVDFSCGLTPASAACTVFATVMFNNVSPGVPATGSYHAFEWEPLASGTARLAVVGFKVTGGDAGQPWTLVGAHNGNAQALSRSAAMLAVRPTRVAGTTGVAPVADLPAPPVVAAAQAPRVAQLPASGYYDGQEVELVADAANGVLWRFKWNAGSPSPYKWEFVGGSSLKKGNLGSFVSGVTNYLQMGAAAIPIALPVGGDYLADFSCQVAESGAISPNGAGATATDENGAVTTLTGQNMSIGRSAVPLNGLSAGTIDLYARSISGAVQSTFSRVYFAVRPVRVAGVAGVAAVPDAGAPMSKPPLVTALPSNPADGDEVYFLASASDGVIWHLRYRLASASPYKWEVLGIPPMLRGSNWAKNDKITVASAWVWYPIAQSPTVQIPLSGDYEVEGSACVQQETTNNFCEVVIGVSWVGSPAGSSYTDQADGRASFRAAGDSHTLRSHDRINGISGGAQLNMVYMCSDTGAWMSNFNRVLKVRPVRVG